MKNKLLVLILQKLVLFPNQEIKLELNNELSKKIVYNALKVYNGELLVVSALNDATTVTKLKDIEKVASFCKIKNAITLPNGNERITLRGVKRVKIKSLTLLEENILEAESGILDSPKYNLDEEMAYSRKIKELVERYVEVNSRLTNAILGVLKNVTNLSKITDMVGATLELNYKQKTKLFREPDYYKRARILITILNNEIMATELENKIEEEVRTNFEKNEKEIVIKEKIKILSREIGLENERQAECEHYYEVINELKVDASTRDAMKRSVKRLEVTSENSPEYGNIRSYLDFITSLPWNKSSKEESDIKKIDDHLNELHYGLASSKIKIEEYISLRKKNKKIECPVLCLVGPPGVGKTTFARELASSIRREFVKVSVGGLNDSSELVGHRKTYIGAGPGKIMEGIRKCGVNNPVVLIDEVDKMMKDYKSDPSSILLAILDQNQNKEFVDNYVQEPFDLSNVIFILTANDEAKIPRALADRLDIIEIDSYTIYDKVEIAKNYTLPRLGKEYGFDYHMIKISDEVLKKIVYSYTHEAGVRDLERKISTIIRKVLIKGLDSPVVIKANELESYLGTDKKDIPMNMYDTEGVVNVPACTTGGGCILNVEVSMYDGCDKIISTGSLGKIMQESTLVALSYLKANAKKFKLDMKSLSRTIHVHALDGATPKDGPSAGLGICVAMVSELQGLKVPSNVAFTGEISLKGRILKVGGIKEKVICASNSKIESLFIPKDNMKDIEKIPNKILKTVEIIGVENFTDVYVKLFK